MGNTTFTTLLKETSATLYTYQVIADAFTRVNLLNFLYGDFKN